MAFRGWFALNGVEFANSSRVARHLGAEIPTKDLGMFASASDCSLDLMPGYTGLYTIPPTSVEVAPGRWSPPDGSRLISPGLYTVGDCWDIANLCTSCHTMIDYDDTWPGLPAWLGDMVYRPEIAPWYVDSVPESGEFGGVWIMDVTGLGPLRTTRDITEHAGDGAAAGPARAPARVVTFDAVLFACTNAGLEHGLQWLSALLHSTDNRTDSVMSYLAAHPGHSAVDPAHLVREVHGVVLTNGPEVRQAFNTSNDENQQATVYRVSWEMTVTRPHSYAPPVALDVDWDEVTLQPVQWVHAADCRQPADCADMPVMFSATCRLEDIEVVTSPPPTCGGCMPVCGVEQRVYTVPTFDQPQRGTLTAVSMVIRNTGGEPLTLTGHWRVCSADDRCLDERWPVQVAGLPPATELHLDAISGRYWTVYDGRRHRAVGIVGTRQGAPWRPPLIDRATCWEFVTTNAPGETYEVSMVLADREA